MYCKKCGCILKDDYIFCQKCGFRAKITEKANLNDNRKLVKRSTISNITETKNNKKSGNINYKKKAGKYTMKIIKKDKTEGTKISFSIAPVVIIMITLIITSVMSFGNRPTYYFVDELANQDNMFQEEVANNDGSSEVEVSNVEVVENTEPNVDSNNTNTEDNTQTNVATNTQKNNTTTNTQKNNTATNTQKNNTTTNTQNNINVSVGNSSDTQPEIPVLGEPETPKTEPQQPSRPIPARGNLTDRVGEKLVIGTTSDNYNEYLNEVKSILLARESENDETYNNASMKALGDRLEQKSNSVYSALYGLDYNYLSDVVNKLDRFYNIVPSAKGAITGYNMGSTSLDCYGYFSPNFVAKNNYYYTMETVLFLNTAEFKGIDKLKTNYARGVQIGWHVKNSTASEAFLHEVAHSVEYAAALRENGVSNTLAVSGSAKQTAVARTWNNQTISTRITRQAVSNIQNRRAEQGLESISEYDLRINVSQYAAYSYAETYAEVIVDYFVNGNNASELTLEMIPLIRASF